ncbi:MAG TPA: hypothetical protein VJ579_00640 [Candidatus Paceibacterota bacterium]|nr:hypothetical protein [Candidatus Paceibacterota bacterium]
MFDYYIQSYNDFVASPYYEPTLVFLGYAYNVVTAFAFIWAPLWMWDVLEPMLQKLKRAEFLKKLEFTTLEIRVPRNIDKSPLAMELVLQALHQPFKPTNRLEKITKGKVNSWFSLEMVSTEGAVHFYVYTPKEYVKLITTHLYSQYPDVEVHETPDYVTKVPFGRDKEEWDLHGTEFILSKADPYPIKTYVDYGLDKLDLKEEFKIDPMTVVLEYLGSIGRGQHAWIQIMIQAHEERYEVKGQSRDWDKLIIYQDYEGFKKSKPKGRDWGKFFEGKWWEVGSEDWMKFVTNNWWTPATQDWKKEADSLIKALKEKAGDKMSAVQRKEIEAMERSVTKNGFDVGIRALYIARKDKYDPSNIAGLMGVLKQFSSVELNGFKDNNVTKIDKKQKIYNDADLVKAKKKMFDKYLRRGFFYEKGKPFVLNTEELATIFHFPGRVSATPTFSRIESRKAEPPSNLPI